MAAGDERAFETLYERHSALLFRYCRAILRSADDGEEAFQATMLNAYRALSRGSGGTSIRPWLYQIAHNQCVSLIRGRRPAERLGDHEVALTGTVHEQVEIQEQLRQLRSDLDSLPPMQRSALVMREMSGLSHRAIGEALATSPSDARQLVYEARQSLSEFSAGRELGCDEIQRRISDGDRRRLRGRRVRAHLRSCTECSAFAEAQQSRTRALASFFPVLPAAIGAAILDEIFATAGGTSSSAAIGSLGPAAVSGPASGAAPVGAAAGGAGVATVGAGLQGLVGTAGTVAGISGLAASGLLRAGSGSAAAGPAGMLSTTTAGGLASAGVAALSIIVAAAVTIGGGQAGPPTAQAAFDEAVAVKGTIPAVQPVQPEPRTGDIAPEPEPSALAPGPDAPAPTVVSTPADPEPKDVGGESIVAPDPNPKDEEPVDSEDPQTPEVPEVIEEPKADPAPAHEPPPPPASPAPAAEEPAPPTPDTGIEEPGGGVANEVAPSSEPEPAGGAYRGRDADLGKRDDSVEGPKREWDGSKRPPEVRLPASPLPVASGPYCPYGQ
ncbi:MAG: sigma-70 family RNA polymerase sigma factor [Thermoleophilia bacterium]|nr:sigma-70 family RNA polymerase sigma factor [Thermoleophilia bacterium]MDH3724661.1 sigma-70 family RNA polymerase sigma factor [Thermoleophilia bacterium]